MTETNEKVEPNPLNLGNINTVSNDDVTPVFQQERNQ